MFSAYVASFDIVSDISIDAGPVNYLFCLCLHLFYPLVCAMDVSEGTVEEFGGTHSVSLQENTNLNGQLILGAPEVVGDSWTCLRCSGHPLRVKYRMLYTMVMFYGSSDGIQFIYG